MDPATQSTIQPTIIALEGVDLEDVIEVVKVAAEVIRNPDQFDPGVRKAVALALDGLLERVR